MIVPEEILNSKILKNQRSVGDFISQLTAEYNELIPFIKDVKEPVYIWDIGCGLGGIDVFLSKHFNNSKIFMTDYNRSDKKIFFGFNPGGYCAYNSFDMTKQLLDANGITDYHFDILDGVRNPPVYADIIISTLSCGFHYPVSMYRDEIINRSLKGTVLILDMRHGEDQRPELSDHFNTVAMLPHRKWSRYIGVRK